MNYFEKTTGQVRKALSGTKKLSEKKMFGGIAFMVNDKMCIAVSKDHILIRCDEAESGELLKRKGAKPCDFTGRLMKGWLMIYEEGTKKKEDFDFWVKTALEANKKAKPSKRK